MPERTARRRRFAPDLRLIVGVVLVVGSVAAVSGIVSAADARAVVLAAAGPLSPGDRIRLGDLVERSVALDGADGLYLNADETVSWRRATPTTRSTRSSGRTLPPARS